MFLVVSSGTLCIFDCCCGWNAKRKEDADERWGLSNAAAANRRVAPSSGGENVRKFKDGFRPLGKHGDETHMIHEIGDNSEYIVLNEMAETRRRRLQELVKKSGNNTCAECGKKSKFYLYLEVSGRIYCYDIPLFTC